MDAGLEAELSPPLQLALAWAPARARDATLALFALDTRLAGFIRRGGEPLAVLAGLGRRALRRGGGPLLDGRAAALLALRLGMFGR